MDPTLVFLYLDLTLLITKPHNNAHAGAIWWSITVMVVLCYYTCVIFY